MLYYSEHISNHTSCFCEMVDIYYLRNLCNNELLFFHITK